MEITVTEIVINVEHFKPFLLSIFHNRWNAQQWGECSVTCGSGGFKMRIVNCQVHVASHGILEYMNDEACSSYDAKPNTRMVSQL